MEHQQNNEHISPSAEQIFVRGAAELHHVMQLHRVWNFDTLMAPYMELLPDVNEPLQAILTMKHIYGWRAEEIVSVLIDAQTKPLDAAGWEEKTSRIVAPADSAIFVPLADAGFTKREFVIRDVPLPDGWDGIMADKAQLQHRLEVTEDVLCYLSEGVRRHTNDRSPVYMVDQAHQLNDIVVYMQTIQEQIAGLDAVETQSDEACTQTETWGNELQDLFDLDVKAFVRALRFADKPLADFIYPEYPRVDFLAKYNQSDPALDQACVQAQEEIAQLSDRAKAVVQKRIDWLSFVAQLDEWRAELEPAQPPNSLDWRHHKTLVPTIKPDDDFLPNHVYDLGDY